MLLGGAGAWDEREGAGEADRDIAAGANLFGAKGREDGAKKSPRFSANINTYDFMDVSHSHMDFYRIN